MKYIYCCPSCGFIGYCEGTDSNAKCPKCGKELYSTGISKGDWEFLSANEKNKLIRQWRPDPEQRAAKPDQSESEPVKMGPEIPLSPPKERHQENTISSFMFCIAILIYIGTFVGGFFLYRQLYFWAGGIILGSLFLGLSEIIKLLQNISERL